MNATFVRYRIHPEHVEANERLIREVFAALDRTPPAGLQYTSVRLDDGSFLHLALLDPAIARSPLLDLPQFRAFQADLRARCSEPPVVHEARLVGNHPLLRR